MTRGAEGPTLETMSALLNRALLPALLLAAGACGCDRPTDKPLALSESALVYIKTMSGERVFLSEEALKKFVEEHERTEDAVKDKVAPMPDDVLKRLQELQGQGQSQP